jgi:type I restriction enzyme, R subunit
MLTANQNPEQLARAHIDAMLIVCGWVVQSKSQLNLQTSKGVAVREYMTSVGPADYVLFVDKIPVGLIQAKREDEGVRLTMHEE